MNDTRTSQMDICICTHIYGDFISFDIFWHRHTHTPYTNTYIPYGSFVGVCHYYIVSNLCVCNTEAQIRLRLATHTHLHRIAGWQCASVTFNFNLLSATARSLSCYVPCVFGLHRMLVLPLTRNLAYIGVSVCVDIWNFIFILDLSRVDVVQRRLAWIHHNCQLHGQRSQACECRVRI